MSEILAVRSRGARGRGGGTWEYSTLAQSLDSLLRPLLAPSQRLVGVYLLRSVELLLRWRDGVDDVAYLDVVLERDGAEELFETTEGGGCFWLFCASMFVDHSVLDIAGDLVQISRSGPGLVGFDEKDVVVSRHAHGVDEVDVVGHGDDKSAVMGGNDVRQ